MKADVIVAPSAARTATFTSGTFDGVDAASVLMIASASADTPSVVLAIEGYDEASDSWYQIVAATALTGTGTKKLMVGPGITVTANESVAQVLPNKWRITATAADADELTYSIGASITNLSS